MTELVIKRPIEEWWISENSENLSVFLELGVDLLSIGEVEVYELRYILYASLPSFPFCDTCKFWIPLPLFLSV